MANEITALAKFTLDNGSLKYTSNPGSIQIDQTTARMFASVVTVGTTEEVVAFGDVAAPRVCVMQNLDATNYCEWGPTDSGAMVVAGRLRPSSIASQFEIDPGITLRMKANTSACDVLVIVTET